MRSALALPLLLPLPAPADWHFSEPLQVTPNAAGVPHLESAGRRNIAVSAGTVAVVWELKGQVYAALRRGEGGFGAPIRLSDGPEAYEPTLTALGHGRFLAAWEQDRRVRSRSFEIEKAGPAGWIDVGPGNQPSLDLDPQGTPFIAWVNRSARFGQVTVGRVDFGPDGAPAPIEVRPADPAPPKDEQLYPALAAVDQGVVVAWEDRGEGYTNIVFAKAQGKGHFGPVLELTEPPVAAGERPQYGRGPGATRVALADHGERVVATWMDKRNYQGGYDIYAALSTSGGRSFGEGELVQDTFGENTPQWHPAVAISPKGEVVVAWDDPRLGNPDIWLSVRTGSGWSDDESLPPAAGPDIQDNPSITFDDEGRLHAAWVERRDGQARILYAVSRPAP